MKTYKETTNRILEKSERVFEKKAHQKKIATSFFSLSFVIVATIAIWNVGSNNLSPTPVTDDLEIIADGNEQNTNSVNDLAEKKEEDAQNKMNDSFNININELSDEPSGAFYALVEESFVEMTKTQLLEYYGVEELDLSEILDGFEEVNNERYGIYYFGDGSECSSHIFTWENESASEIIRIEFARNNIPISAPFRINNDGTWGNAEELKTSEINGVNLMLCSYLDSMDNSCFHAEFLMNKTGLSIYSQNVSEDDLLKVLIYLIKNI